MNRYSKLGKDIAWMTVGSFASKVLSFFLIPLYTSVLSTEQFGTADLIATTIVLLSPVFTLQVSEAVLRYSLDKNLNPKSIITSGIVIVLIGFFALTLLTPLLLMFKPIKEYYWLFILYYLSSVINSLLSQFTKGLDKVSYYAISGMIQTASVIVFNLLFLLVFEMGTTGYLLSFILSNFLSSTFLSVTVKLHRLLSPLSKSDFALVKSMLKYSIPMIPNSISWWISNSSDKYLVNYYLDTAAVGIYSISYKIPTLLSSVNSIFMSAWQISAVKDFGSKQSAQFFSNIYKQLSSLNTVIVSFLIITSRLFAKVLYANDFYIAWKYALVLCFAFYFSSLSSFLGSIYTTSKKTPVLFYTSMIGAILNILSNIVLIPQLGAVGAAISTVVSYSAVWIIRFFHVDKLFVFEKKITLNIISIIVLLVQSVLVYNNKLSFDLIASLMFVMLLILNRKTLFDIYKHFFKKVDNYSSE